MCLKNNYKSSTLGVSSTSTCYCDITLQAQISENSCWCSCINSINRFCGCSDNLARRVYSVRSQNTSGMIISVYSGCVKQNSQNFSFTVHLGFMTNDLCIQICKQKNHDYALTEQG